MFSRAVEDVRRQAEAEKLRTPAKILVLKERELWESEKRQLLEENNRLQKKLSISQKRNSQLNADLQTAKREIRRREEEISSLRHHLSALEHAHNAAQDAWGELKNELQKAEEVIQKREEEIVSLNQSLHAHKVEVERTRASLEEWKDSSGLNEVSQLKELLRRKDLEVIGANKMRRRRTDAHVLTLAQLNGSQAALKKSQMICEALEEKLQKQLAESEESHQQELSAREESFRRDLSQRVERFKKELSEKEENFRQQLSLTESTSRQELSKVRESWEKTAQQWDTEKKDLEEMLLMKEKLKLEKKKQKKRFWCWSRQS